MKDLILSYLSTLGLAGILIGMILEALGIPGFPGGLLVILAGFLVHEGVLEFHSALAAAFTGNTLGASAAYLLGRNVGEPFFVRYGRYLRVPPQKLREAQELFARSAGAFLLVGRFVPGLGNLTPYLFGQNWHRIWALLQPHLILAAAVAAAVSLLYCLRRGKIANRGS